MPIDLSWCSSWRGFAILVEQLYKKQFTAHTFEHKGLRDGHANIFTFYLHKHREIKWVTPNPKLAAEPGLKFGALDLKIRLLLL